MTTDSPSQHILDAAKDHGASLAGIARVSDVRNSPGHQAFDRMGDYTGVGTPQEGQEAPSSHEIPGWPEQARSVIVVALEHPRKQPELDWWDGNQGTPGNRQLIHICKSLRQWMEDALNLTTFPMHYFVQKCGTFLKDAAVIAGLGCMGKNNLLITPQFGPRVRIRAFLVQADLAPSPTMDFDPCQDCPVPCRKVCPIQAMDSQVWTSEQLGCNHIPARDGAYSRDLCNTRMELDIQESEPTDQGRNLVKYCRKCEFACPVGRS
ncbi:MAG: hypothetical protein U5L00_04980 [Desulfovermiculus sp.]|nr:hypothetical protein [Desulfovermiculus sp.]